MDARFGRATPRASGWQGIPGKTSHGEDFIAALPHRINQTAKAGFRPCQSRVAPPKGLAPVLTGASATIRAVENELAPAARDRKQVAPGAFFGPPRHIGQSALHRMSCAGRGCQRQERHQSSQQRVPDPPACRTPSATRFPTPACVIPTQAVPRGACGPCPDRERDPEPGGHDAAPGVTQIGYPTVSEL